MCQKRQNSKFLTQPEIRFMEKEYNNVHKMTYNNNNNNNADKRPSIDRSYTYNGNINIGCYQEPLNHLKSADIDTD